MEGEEGEGGGARREGGRAPQKWWRRGWKLSKSDGLAAADTVRQNPGASRMFGSFQNGMKESAEIRAWACGTNFDSLTNALPLVHVHNAAYRQGRLASLYIELPPLACSDLLVWCMRSCLLLSEELGGTGVGRGAG